MSRETDPQILDAIWAVVLMQGAITLLSAIEAFVGGLGLGSIAGAAPVILLTLGGAALALGAARGIRLRRPWARRVTVIAEFLLLGTGLLGMAANLLMRQAPVGLVPFLTTILVPITVLILLKRDEALFEGGG